MHTRPIVFLDFDDVICLNLPGGVGGYDVLLPGATDEVFSQVFSAVAVETLLTALTEHDARVVITTSWLRFMNREKLVDVLERTGMHGVVERLHEGWEARGPGMDSSTRGEAIWRWLQRHHQGEPYVILDDRLSGTGLRGGMLVDETRVVWCEVGVGLNAEHLPAIRSALTTPI
jgi:hypothetical protein